MKLYGGTLSSEFMWMSDPCKLHPIARQIRFSCVMQAPPMIAEDHDTVRMALPKVILHTKASGFSSLE